MCLDVLHLPQQHAACHKEADDVRDGHGPQHAVEAPPVGQQGKQGRKEQQLARKAKEDALSGMADALEEVSDDNLYAHDGEHGRNDAESVNRERGELGTRPEDFHDGSGHEFGYQEGGGGYHASANHAKAQHGPYAVVEVGSPVVSDNRLHALDESEDNHYEEEEDAVDDSIGSDGHVSAVLEQLVVAQENHQTAARIDQEGAEADGQRLPHDVGLERIDAAAQVEQFVLAAEELQLPHQRDGLGQDGGPCSALDSPAEGEDEQGVKDGVEDDGEKGAVHGRSGVAGAAEHCIQAKIAVRYDVANQNDTHVVPCIGQGGFAGTEEGENLVQEGQADEGKERADDDVQADGVAQNVLCRLVIPLAQTHADDGAGSHAHHCAQSGGEVHEGAGHRHSVDGHVADALAHKDAVDDVVGGCGRHGNDGRNRITDKQGEDVFRTQFGRDVGFYVIHGT